MSAHGAVTADVNRTWGLHAPISRSRLDIDDVLVEQRCHASRGLSESGHLRLTAGLGSRQATDAVKVRPQPSSATKSAAAASSSPRVLSARVDQLLQVLFVLLTQRESCSEVSSLPPLSVSLLLPSASLSPHVSETKPVHRQRQRPKSHQPCLPPKAVQGTLGCANALQRTVYRRQVLCRQSAAAAGSHSRYAPILQQCRSQCRQASKTDSCSKT